MSEMRCEEALERLEERYALRGDQRAMLAAHLEVCESCGDAARAVEALRSETAMPVPKPPAGAFERALRAAVQADGREQAPATGRTGNRSWRGFWLGTGVGGAVAASIVAALVVLWAPAELPPAGSAPQVTLALNEVRDVNIAVESPQALADARVRVVLHGAVGLAGYEGQRVLEWTTRLERGANQLTLPLVVTDSLGGQLVVEVAHGDRQRAFVVDVRAGSGETTTT